MSRRSTTVYRRQAVYLPEEISKDLLAEALRIDRSPSWVMRKVWEIAREELKFYPPAPVPTPPSE